MHWGWAVKWKRGRWGWHITLDFPGGCEEYQLEDHAGRQVIMEDAK